MTRAQGPGTEISYRIVDGAPGAARVVVVVRSGVLATSDPAPAVTTRWDVRLLLIGLEGEELRDPPAFGGETPAGSTAAQVLSLLEEEVDGATLGLVAERAAAGFAVALAADLGERVDRLALVAPDAPETPLADDLMKNRLIRVTADALVVDTLDHEATARGYADRMRAGRVEWDSSGHPGDGRLPLSHVWERVLDHVAPGAWHR